MDAVKGLCGYITDTAYTLQLSPQEKAAAARVDGKLSRYSTDARPDLALTRLERVVLLRCLRYLQANLALGEDATEALRELEDDRSGVE